MSPFCSFRAHSTGCFQRIQGTKNQSIIHQTTRILLSFAELLTMATATPGLSTKKIAALRVFGESLVLEDDSLSYSVSSDKIMGNVPNMNEENDPNSKPVQLRQYNTTPTKAHERSKESSKRTVSFSIPIQGEDKAPTRDIRTRELFQSQRSPLRPDLVRRTQDAINRATMSVNERILMEKKGQQHQQQPPKKLSARENLNKVAAVQLKMEWKDDIQEAREFNEQIHQSRLRVLAFKKQLSSQGSRDKARRQQAQYSTNLATIDKESQFNSLVYREQQQRLRDEDDRRRRMSVEARAKLRQNAIKGKERMRMQRIDEDMAIVEERHEASKALREKKAHDAGARRKSFVFRNGDARRIRELHQLMEEERQQKEHLDFLLEEEANRDVDAYKRQQQEERRKSLLDRQSHASKHRQIEMQKRATENQEKEKIYELEFGAARDVDAYKKQLQKERRISLAGRNEEARRHREQEKSQKEAELMETNISFELKRNAAKDVEQYLAQQAEERRRSLELRGHEHQLFRQEESKRKLTRELDAHSSLELKWAGEKDIEAYQKHLAESRRQSLAFRNNGARGFREKQSKQQSEDFAKEHESFELKWNGQRDAENFRKQQEQLRRESLAQRNREGLEQRKKRFQEEGRRKETEHASFELKWAAEKDVEEFQKQMQEERRQSLANRNAERARHCNVMNELRQIAQEKESESYALKWAGENDAKAYLAQIEDERRQSLQLRGEQVRKSRKVDDDVKTQELIKQAEDEKMRAKDHKDMKEYQAKCAQRDRTSLEFRGKEINRQRLLRNEQVVTQQRLDRNNFELESFAQKDVEEYLKECHQRRRLSLAFRAKEKRRHADWKQTQEQKEVQERSRLVHGRLMDQRYVELAKQEEKAKKALEDIRHSNRTFNPFSNLL